MAHDQTSVGLGEVRVGAGVHLRRLLAEHGVHPDSFFIEQGVDPSVFDDSDQRIPYATNASIYKAAAEATRLAGLPVLVGLSSGLDELGPLGLAMRKAGSVFGALKVAETAFRLQVRGVQFAVSTDGDLARVQYAIIDSDVLSGGHISAGALANLCSVMRQMCGPVWRPVSVELPLRPPVDKAAFTNAFGHSISFNRPVATLRFDSGWLDKAPLCGIQGAQSPNDLRDEIVTREVVETACLREALDGHIAAIAKVADEIGWSKRTLCRRLNAEGSSFDDIRRKVIFGAARRLLNDTDMSVTAIALALGYSEVAAFTRAFRSWAGCSPSEMRVKSLAKVA